MIMPHRILVLAILIVHTLITPLNGAEWVCWSSDQTKEILCAQPGVTDPIVVMQSTGKPMGMTVDQVHNVLYWAERDTNRIMSAALAGDSNPTIVAQLGLDPGLRGMAIAPTIGKVYWVAENTRAIQRANLDGSQFEILSVPDGSFFDVEIDEASGTLYWTNGSEIWSGGLDGSSPTLIIGDAGQPYYLALDIAGGKLYWTDFSSNEIGRANLDGTDHEIPGPISALSARPRGITLDLVSNKVYWTLESGAIQRANLDGTNIETVFSNLDSSWDITMLDTLPTIQSIPAVSTWGVVTLLLALLIAGTLIVGRKSTISKVCT